jgi:MFS family permease
VRQIRDEGTGAEARERSRPGGPGREAGRDDECTDSPPASGGSSRRRIPAIAMPRTFASLSDRNYALFYAGQILSLTGSWAEKPALQSLAYKLTGHSEAWISWVAVIPLLPTLIVSVPAGAFSDRHDPRRIVIWTQALMMLGAAAMATVVLCGWCTIWHIVAYSAYSAAVFAVDAAARQSLVVHLVPRERLTNAVALNSSMFSVARFVGGAVYGAIIRYTGLGNGGCIAVNSVSFAFVLGGLFLMKWTVPPRPEPKHPTDVWEGVRYVWRTPTVRAALLVICALSMFGFQVSQILVVYAVKVWNVGDPGFADMQVAAGLGAFLGSLILATRGSDVHRGRMMLGYCVAAAAFLALFASVPAFLVGLVTLGCGAFVMTQAQSAGNSLIQHVVPDELRGRVMSLYTAGVLASFPIGGFLAGFAAGKFGAPATTMADAAVILAAVAAIAATHPSLRKTR